MGTVDKMLYFSWMASIVAIYKEETRSIVGGPRVNSLQFTKNTLKFKAKTYWTVARHRLCPTIGDNVLRTVCITLVSGLMVGYDFDVAQFIAREIYDRAVVSSDVILAFPCF